MKLREDGWAIVGNHGLYTGWHFIRREMIAQHVSELHGVSSFTLSSKLDKDQLAAWRQCQKQGDRAIKISISTRS